MRCTSIVFRARVHCCVVFSIVSLANPVRRSRGAGLPETLNSSSPKALQPCHQGVSSSRLNRGNKKKRGPGNDVKELPAVNLDTRAFSALKMAGEETPRQGPLKYSNNPGVFCHMTHDEMSSVLLHSGFRLP